MEQGQAVLGCSHCGGTPLPDSLTRTGLASAMHSLKVCTDQQLVSLHLSACCIVRN